MFFTLKALRAPSRSKPGHARQAHAFLAATLEEVVAAADRDLPSDTKMSVQERFFSHVCHQPPPPRCQPSQKPTLGQSFPMGLPMDN